ncbi:hypothetical protein [Moheibacter sediminis]|uniref:Phospholipase_D-nuclease N-terminal n=1 Tax=Moheibacter sediminis TaxID=1434700 RepID=A0A1W1ZE23_9FLAO|nr:hypothetical protein [Moheibacter sediminis]SMC46637.1 hypothetical protein SAMN06296427_102420 [Moheibacter sediminis]
MKILNNKSLQTFLAIGPMISIIITLLGYFIFAFGTVIYAIVEEPESDPSLFFTGGMLFFFVLMILSFILSLANIVFFVLHAAKNPNLEKENMRLIWILVIVFVMVFGLGSMIYWFAEIKTKNPKPIIPNQF